MAGINILLSISVFSLPNNEQKGGNQPEHSITTCQNVNNPSFGHLVDKSEHVYLLKCLNIIQSIEIYYSKGMQSIS